MALVDINWHPSPKELRVFAILQCAFWTLAAWWIAARFAANTAAAVILGAALIAAAVGLAAPALLRPVYVAWLAAVWPIGWAVSHVAMVGLFYLVITPAGLIMRACGRDPMCRQFDRAARTYWRQRTEDRDVGRYFRQF